MTLTVSLLIRASSSCWKPPPMGPCAGVVTGTALPFADSSNTRGRGADKTVLVVVSMAAWLKQAQERQEGCLRALKHKNRGSEKVILWLLQVYC